MPIYKLTYFDMPGVAEESRMIFKIAGVDFEDVRISWADWPSKREEMPLQTLPILEIDGKTYCQASAISKYLARKFGLLGSSAEDGFRIDELLETINDIYWRHLKASAYNPDKEKQKEIVEQFVDVHAKMYLDFIENRFKEKNDATGFYCGDSITLADLSLYALMCNLKAWAGKHGFVPYTDRPLLDALKERVENHPKLVDYLKSGLDNNFLKDRE